MDDIKYVNKEIENEDRYEEMGEFGLIPRKRSISFNKDSISRSHSMAEEEMQSAIRESNNTTPQ